MSGQGVFYPQMSVVPGGNTAGATGMLSSGTVSLVGGNNITLSQNGQTLSIVGGAGAGGYAAGNTNAGNTAGDTGVVTGQLVLVGSNNITLSGSTNAGSMTLSILGGAGAAGIAGVVATDATYTSGTIIFSNQANITINSSVNGASQYVRLSGNAAQTNQSAIKAFGVSNTGQTAGNTGVSTGIDWVLAGSGSITLSQSTAVGGPNTVWMQHPAWLTTQSGQAFSADASSAFQTLVFQDSNGISFSNNAGSLRVTHGLQFTSATSAITSNALNTSASRVINIIAATNNTGGGTASLSSNVSFSAANGITFYTSAGNAIVGTVKTDYLTTQTNQQMTLFATGNTTLSSSGTTNASSLIFRGTNAVSVGITNGSVVIDAPNAAAGNVTFSASANSSGLASVIFANSNNITFGLTTGSQITASFGGGGGIGGGVSTGGNTDGSTGTVTTGNVIFVGTGALTLSQSTGAAGSAATITFSVPQTSSLVGTNGISVSTNGSTISASVIEISHWRNRLGGVTQAGTAQANSLVSIQPFLLQIPVALSNVMIAASVAVATAANNSSGYVDVSASAVIYSRNVSTLSSIGSFNNTFTISFSSNATGTVTGVQGLALTGVAKTLTQGEYFIAIHMSTANSATGGAATTALANTLSMIIADNMGSAANQVKVWGAQTNASLGFIAGQGVLSTGATRATIGFSDYVMTGTRGILAPVAFELRNQSWWG